MQNRVNFIKFDIQYNTPQTSTIFISAIYNKETKQNKLLNLSNQLQLIRTTHWFILFIQTQQQGNMSINIWNLSQSKTSFFIRQRTQAQRKHLNKLKKIKGKIELKRFGHTSNLVNQMKCSDPTDLYNNQGPQAQAQNKRKSLSNNNQSTLSTTVSVRNKSLQMGNTSYIDNLRISSSLSRLRQNQQIQKQNGKIIIRLINAKPSISQELFKKNHFAHLKYKRNILKNKYVNLDYTAEANCSEKSSSHLLLKPIQNLGKIKQSRVSSKLKTQLDEPSRTNQYRLTKSRCHQSSSRIKD